MCANGYGGIFGDMRATRYRVKKPIDIDDKMKMRVIREARRYAESLGCSPDVTRDCECVVGVVFKARNNYDKESIARYVATYFGCST